MSILTPEEKSEKIKLEKSQSFELITDNKKYNLIISYNDKLICFEIEKVEQFPKKQYYLYLNMEQLYKINGFFRALDSIPDIFSSLKNIIEKNNLLILEEDNNMKMKIINPINNIPFFIEIPAKEKQLKEEMESITNYIVTVKNELNEKIKEGNQKIILLEEKIKLLEEEVEELMKFKKNYEITNKEEIKIENRFFSSSNIIKYEDENMIINWFDNKPIRFCKLFDSKEKGDNIQTFYNICQNIHRLIIFIKTLNGYRFGGYISFFPPITYKSNYSNYNYLSDNKAFVFSIDKKEKFDINNSSKAAFYYYDNSKDGNNYFKFGDGAIVICDGCTMHSKNYAGDDGIYNNFTNKINGGESYFIVESFEIYQLECKME